MNPEIFLPFFLSERLAKGSIRSTNVPDDIVTLPFVVVVVAAVGFFLVVVIAEFLSVVVLI